MGLGVGALVGAADGLAVGDAEGTGVGAAVGALVGAGVGEGEDDLRSHAAGTENWPKGQSMHNGTGAFGSPLASKRIVLLLNWPSGHNPHCAPAWIGAGVH